jgi:hypothetical protein
MNHCPICDHTLDTHAKVPGSGPSVTPMPGDVTLCWNCCAVLTFNQVLSLITPSAEELKEIESDPDFNGFINAVRTAIKNKPSKN